MPTPEAETVRQVTGERSEGATAEGTERAPALRPLAVARAALGTYRRHTARVAVIALVIFVPLTLADIFVTRLSEALLDDVGPVLAAFLLVAALALTSGELVAVEFFAGLLDRLVDEDQYGRAPVTLGENVRSLPHARLALASLLVWAITSAGTAILIVPGIVAFTFLSLSGPIINVERRGVIAGLRHSVRLVRGHFWLVFACVTLPLVAEEAIVAALHDVQVFHGAVAFFLLEVGLAVTLGSVIALNETTIALALMTAHGRQDAPRPRRNP